MGEIKSIYDAIVKTKVPEDQCTNFLVYLLGKLPKTVLLEIIKTAELNILSVDETTDITTQYILENSRPDAVVEFSVGKHLIIETKRFPDRFDRVQFNNHIEGGKTEFGIDNAWWLFLSGDQQCPADLVKIKEKNIGKIGFISWKKLLALLEQKTKQNNFPNSILISEFLIFAKHLKLGKLTTMNTQELQSFIENYGLVSKRESAEEYFNSCIEKIKDKIIIECEELVEPQEKSDDYSNLLPCFYRTFDIKRWHLKEYSAYVFIDVLLKQIGVILVGYHKKNEKEEFQKIWDAKYKKLYKNHSDLISLTWDEEDDNYKDGYFKTIKGASGKHFNPTQIDEIGDTFYWGHLYPLKIDALNDKLYDEMAADFKRMLNTFIGK